MASLAGAVSYKDADCPSCCALQGLCDDDVTVQQFCTKYVEPMGEESDHIQLVALTDALLVSPPSGPQLRIPTEASLMRCCEMPESIQSTQALCMDIPGHQGRLIEDANLVSGVTLLVSASFWVASMRL